MKFYRNNEIEDIAEKRLLEFEKCTGKPLSLPIDIDVIGENILGLDFLWESIQEHPGEVILGALSPSERQIILNENRMELFKQKPGLERSTKGHEMGHWDLFIDKSLLNHPTLFDGGEPELNTFRGSPSGDLTVLRALIQSEEGLENLRKIYERSDEADEARCVNRYAAAVSMPRFIIEEEIQKIDRTKWPNLYNLKDRFGVNISALCVRLEQLGLLYIKDKNLYESKAQALGQETFAF